MAISVEDSGAQTATLTTWHDVATVTATPGVYLFSVDASNLVYGEVLDVQIKKNCRSADSQAVLYLSTVTGVQTAPVIDSVPVVVTDDATFSIRQTGGTGRSFPWALIRTDG